LKIKVKGKNMDIYEEFRKKLKKIRLCYGKNIPLNDLEYFGGAFFYAGSAGVTFG